MNFVTLTSESYVPGTLALLQSFKEYSGISGARWTVMIEDDLTGKSIRRLENQGAQIVHRRSLGTFNVESKDFRHERFVRAMQKLTVFLLETKGEDVCFLDSDVIVLKDISQLLKCKPFTSVGIVGRGLSEPVFGRPPFSGGLMILKPSQETYDRVQAYANGMSDTRMGDQQILQHYFYETDPEGVHLLDVEFQMIDQCWEYNPKMFLSRVPKMIHYCAGKPWLNDSPVYQPLNDLWWSIYRRVPK